MPFPHCAALWLLSLTSALFLILAAAAPSTAEVKLGTSTAYDCDYQTGGMCTCDGGHNTDDCEKLKRSGVCSAEDGTVVMCCQGSTCSCVVGGQKDGGCPPGATPNVSQQDPSQNAPSPAGAVRTMAAPDGGSTAWECRQGPSDPSPRCTCQGGPTSPDCESMFSHGNCNNSYLCCSGVGGGNCFCDPSKRELPACAEESQRKSEMCECFDIVTGKKVDRKPALGAVKGGPSAAGAAMDRSTPKQAGQVQPSLPDTQESVPTQTEQPVPTKPGFIWVDDHWERPRAM